MAETQIKQLIKMMNDIPTSKDLKVYLPSIQIKKKSLKRISKGDIILLKTEDIAVDIVEDDNIIARGLYGNYNEIPSILIDKFTRDKKSSKRDKRYHVVKILLGTIEDSQLDIGKIVKLKNDREHHLSLFLRDRLVAKARLVHRDREIALQIDEVRYND